MRKAFTLAEVLITLGIIGVVAAMTLPSLIERNRRVELQNGLKAAYSLLQQALQRMNADYGYTILPSDYKARKFKPEYINILTIRLTVNGEEYMQPKRVLYAEKELTSMEMTAAAWI